MVSVLVPSGMVYLSYCTMATSYKNYYAMHRYLVLVLSAKIMVYSYVCVPCLYILHRGDW